MSHDSDVQPPEKQPPGWYDHPAKGGRSWYWDGVGWVDDKTHAKMIKNERKIEARRWRNSKLTTIGVLALICLGIGLFTLIVTGADPGGLVSGLSFMGAGAGLWITWLSFGAIVDELRRLRQ